MNKCIHVKSVICKSIVSNVLAFIAIACNVWCNTTIISKNKEIKKIECRKTNTNHSAITLTNHMQQTQKIMNQSKLEAGTSGAKRGYTRTSSPGFNFTSDWLRKWREMF